MLDSNRGGSERNNDREMKADNRNVDEEELFYPGERYWGQSEEKIALVVLFHNVRHSKARKGQQSF